MNDLAREQRERRIARDLSRLASNTTPEVDVRARVLARIANLRPQRVPRPGTWMALAASVLLAACLGLANAATLPELPRAVRDIASLTRAPRSVVAGLASNQASSVLASVSEAVSRLFVLLAALFEILERYAWLWKPCLALGFGIACLSAALILLREFRRAPRVSSLEENHHDA